MSVTTPLYVFMCFLVDIPENGVDCSSLLNETECFSCQIAGRYISGEGIDEYGGVGHSICLALAAMIILLGVCGTLTNIVIVAILRRQKTPRAFDTLLLALAICDLFCSAFNVITTVAAITYFQNWNRNGATLAVFIYGILIMLFARSGSNFMTVAITVERYLMVAFPFRSRTWFSPVKTKLLAAGAIIFSSLLAFPRFSSVYVGMNDDIGKGIESTKHLEYLIHTTTLFQFWYVDAKQFFDELDACAPLPLLLVFNGLVFYYMRRFARRRRCLNLNQSEDVKDGQMFTCVVIVLFVCNIPPIVYYRFIHGGVIYRELTFGVMLSTAANSAANLPIYYSKGARFRKEARLLISEYFPNVDKFLSGIDEKGKGHDEETIGTTGSHPTLDEKFV